ncbi:MAG: hypothetical protein ACOCZK_03535 [Planctomycetota bacterium]
MNIRFFRLPAEGMPLSTFVERVTQTMTPPYTLVKDHGIQEVGGSKFHVHDLKKDGGRRASWSAWFTITDTNHGLWILCEYGGTSSREEVLQIIGSMRRPAEPDPQPILTATDDRGRYTVDLPKAPTPPSSMTPRAPCGH